MKRLYVLIFLFSTLLQAGVTPGQLAVLQKVRDVARTVPDKWGETYENTLSAICITESSAGRNIIGDFEDGVKITRASLGAMQVQVATARYVSKKVDALASIKTMSDKEVANALLSDIDFSARIAAHYLVILKNRRQDYMHSVSGYNGGTENWPYFSRVMKNMELVKSLIASGELK